MFAANRLLPALRTPRFDLSLGEVDRLFDQLFNSVNGSVQASGWSAPWAWWEDEGHVYMEFELPGAKNEEIEIVLEHGKLHLKFERKVPEGQRQYRYNNRRF